MQSRIAKNNNHVMTKKIIIYITFVGVFSILGFFILNKGKELNKPGNDSVQEQVLKNNTAEETGYFNLFKKEIKTNIKNPLSILIIQIISIVFFARLFGYLFSKIGQPTVIGEVVAGIVLGPSVVGMLFPAFSVFLFPVESLGNIKFLSQVGLILFMFIVGMELDVESLKNKAKDAVVISHASILFPYILGMGLAYFLYLEFAPPDISFFSFALFMGIAMSITAFPVLARIVKERGLSKRPLGIMSITCAASDDVTAWCILALVIASVKAGSILGTLLTISLALAYVLIMLYVLKPFLVKMTDKYVTKEQLNKTVVVIVFLILLVSAYISEVVGIHALFGSFLAGVIMPRNKGLRKILTNKIEDVSMVLLLPLFFVFTGLRTKVGLLNSPDLWTVCAMITAIAIIGKFGGSALAARAVGQNWKDSLSIGALMNTRGLMELIVLNIGYDLGILTQQVFTMMVLMALITTFMTCPSLDLINYLHHKITVKNRKKISLDNERVVVQ